MLGHAGETSVLLGSAWPRRLVGFVAKQHRPTVSGPESLVLAIPAPVPYIE